MAVIIQIDGDVKSFTNKLQTLGTQGSKAMGNLGKAIAVVDAAVITAGIAAVKSGIQFESAFAGVQKTVDATEAEFAKLNRDIRDLALEIPMAATEIAGIAEAAGQLGIETPNIMAFTRTMADLGVATNMSADQAATALARMANITGMAQSDFDRLGSSIVALGNNMATTESEIVDMSLRLAGAANNAGFTEAEILGLSAALSSVGMEAQAGGGSISRVINQIGRDVAAGGENLRGFAEIAGMTGAEFKKLWETDAAAGFDAFIRGLGKVKEEGGNISTVLREVGISETIATTALTNLAGNSDLLSEALGISNQAWRENTALTKEAEQRYQTTESKIQLLKNSVTDLALDAFDLLFPVVQGVVKALQGFVNVLRENPAIIKVVVIALAAITAAYIAYNVVQWATTAASTAMAAATWAALAPILLIIAAIAALATGAILLANHLSKASFAAGELGDVVTETGDKISESTAESVGAYLELANEADMALKTLSWSGSAMTKDMADNIIGSYNRMKEMTIAAVEEQRDEVLLVLEDLYAKAGMIAEGQETMDFVSELYAGQIERVEELTAQKNFIIEKALAEERELTEGENGRIAQIELELQAITVGAMSQSSAEQLAILQHLKNNATEISAEQAAEIVSRSIEQRDATIQAADEAYYGAMAAAQLLRAEGTEEARLKAEEIEALAQQEYDATVGLANQQHNDIVAEAQAQAGEHVDQVDWETGEVLTKWQVFWNNFNEGADEWGLKLKGDQESLGETIRTSWDNVTGWVGGAWDTIKTTVSTAATNVFNTVKTWAGNVFQGIKDAWANIKEVGTNLVQGIWEGISGAFDWIIGKLREWAGSVINAIKGFFGIKSPSTIMRDQVGLMIGEGVAEGITASTPDILDAVAEQGAELIDAYALLTPDISANESMGVDDSLRARFLDEFGDVPMEFFAIGQSSGEQFVAGFSQEINGFFSSLETKLLGGVIMAGAPGYSGAGMGGDVNINFNEPMESPDAYARSVSGVFQYGLAGDRD